MEGPASHRDERRASVFTTLRDLRLSVIVPVFNEVGAIRQNLDVLMREVTPYFSTCEIVVVSDGSTDGTNAVLLALDLPGVRAIVYEKNMGKGYAVREGLKAASGDYVLFIDGGMELHPRAIRTFLGLMELYDSDVVIGSKRHPQSQIEYPAVRRVLSFLYQLLVRNLFDLNVTDTQVGIKLFKREVIAAILPELTIDRYGFDLELLALARRCGYRRFLEAPIRLDYFRKNHRSSAREFYHVGRIVLSILADTFRLYRRIRRLPPVAPGRRPTRKGGDDHDQVAA